MLARFSSRQSGEHTCGAFALSVLLQRYGIRLSERAILRRVGAQISENGITLGVLRKVCRTLGLPAFSRELPCEALASLKTPCIAHLRIGHYVVAHALDADSVWMSDPNVGTICIHEKEFLASWTGFVLIIDRPAVNDFVPPYGGVKGAYDKYLLRILKFSKPYLAWVIPIAVTVSVNAAIGLGLPLAVMYMIDKLLVEKDQQGMAMITVLLFALAVGQALASVISGLLYTTVSNAILLDMRAKFLHDAQRLSLLDLSRFSAGDLLSRLLGDVTAIQVFISSTSFGALINGLAAVVLVVAAISVNPRLGLIGLAPLPLFIIPYALAYRNLAAYGRQHQIAQGKLTGQAQRILLGLETIKTYSREVFETAVFDQMGVDSWKAAWKVELLQQLMSGLTVIMASAGPVLVLLYGGIEILDQKLTLGALMGMNLFVARAFEPFMALTHQYSQWRTAAAAAERYFEVLDTPPSVQEIDAARPISHLEGHILFREVGVDYGKGPVLHSISAEIKAGAIVALIGPNGGGKSTLLQLVVRHVDATTGSVLIDGIDAREYRLSSLRAHIAHATPTPLLFEGSILDNVRYSRFHATEAEVLDVLKVVGLRDFVDEQTGQLQFKVAQNGGNLSLGQRQRLGLARALLKRPAILILDEGTNSLDVQSEHDILCHIREFLPKATLLLVSHRPWVASLVDHIYYVEGGRILGDGPHGKLVESCQAYTRLCEVAQLITGQQLVP